MRMHSWNFDGGYLDAAVCVKLGYQDSLIWLVWQCDLLLLSIVVDDQLFPFPSAVLSGGGWLLSFGLV